MADVEVQTNLTATVAPTVNDDVDAGYSVFSPYVDIAANRVYFAADVSPGAAKWREVIGGVVSGGANNQVITDDGSGGLVSESGLVFNGSQLLILGEGANNEIQVFGYNDLNNGTDFEAYKARGTRAVPLAVIDGDNLGVFKVLGLDGSAFLAVAEWIVDVDGPVSTGVVPGVMIFKTQNTSGTRTEALRIDSSQRIGINNPAPVAKFDIIAPASVTGLNVKLDATPGDAVTVTNSGSTVLFVVDGTGLVGVGTGSPAFDLDVDAGTTDNPFRIKGDNNVTMRFDTSSSNSTARNWYVGCNVVAFGDWNVQQSDAQGGNPLSAGTSRFYISETGLVGVANTGPVAQLDVTAPASTVAFNIDLNATPGSAITVTNSSSVVLFAVESDGETTTEFDSVFNTTEGGTARLTRQTSHETHTLAAAATSDTTTISIPSGARLLAVSFTVNATVVDSAGDDTWSAAFITGSTTTLATGISPVINTKRNLMLPDEISTGVCQIRFTAQGGSFSAGVIEIVAYFESLTSLANV